MRIRQNVKLVSVKMTIILKMMANNTVATVRKVYQVKEQVAKK